MGLRYEPNFDGLRAIAVLVVVAFHCRTPGFSGGFIGVDVFFVLSGYLITSMLRAGTPGFYVRRAKRLVPAFALMLSVYLIAAPMLWPEAPAVPQTLIAGLYLSDYLRPLGPLSHTWSLAAEAQFYLAWPLVVACLPGRWSPYVLAAAWVVATAWRLAVIGMWGWEPAYYHLDSHASGLVLGALLTYVPPRPARYAWIGLAVLCALTVGLRFMSPFGTGFGIALAEGAAALLVLGARAPGPSLFRSILSSRPMVAVGILSYGIYLWHYPVAVLLRDRWPWTVSLPITVVAATVAAAISYFTVELLARRTPVRSRAAVQPT